MAQRTAATATSPAAPGGAAAFSESLADAVSTVAASTLRVHARRGPPASGIALSADLVVTADHVVDPSREKEIRVGLPDGQEVAASLVGRDPATDVALLRVAEGGLTPATASGGEPRVGSLALLVARPGREPSASFGLVSALGGPTRTRRGGMLERYILVDTVMYPGFSGGPLVDPAGRVLGMATSGLAMGGPDVAIPWAVVRRVADTLAQHGRVARGYLGIGSQPIQLAESAKALVGGAERGLLVVHVADNGPAAQAGILQGDILVKLESQAVANADDLQALLGPDRVGKPLQAAVIRGGELQEVRITVGARD